MANDERAENATAKRILGIIFFVLGAIGGYFLVRYLMSR